MENNNDSRIMTVGDWMITLLVLALPLVNIIMYIVWALDNNGNLNRRNFCRASLLWFAIVMGIAIVIGVVMAILGVAVGAAQNM
jgi:small neutral amino acid transporter SnatA (MarC family)